MPNYHYSVGLSQNPDDIRFGYTNQKTYLYNQARDRSIVNGINLFISLANKFTQAYVNTSLEDITFLNQKDLFVSIALGKITRCCQTTDSAYEALTPHAEKYWTKIFAYREVWGEVPISYINTNVFDRVDSYYGPAGSLGFYLYKYNVSTDSLSPIQIIEEAISRFWSELGISAFTSPTQQHREVLTKVGLFSVTFDLYTTALKYIWANPNIDPVILNIVRRLRADAINTTDFDSLKQKLMFATIKPSVLEALTSLQVFINNYSGLSPLPSELSLFKIAPNTFNEIQTNILNICKPAGFALIYQVFAIQSLIRASRVITTAPIDIIKTSYYDSIRYGKNSSLLLDLANNLSTAYDAYSALAYLNTMQEARGYSYFIYQKIVELINYDVKLTIPFTNNNFRLQDFK